MRRPPAQEPIRRHDSYPQPSNRMSPHGGALMSQNQNPMISSESTNQNRFDNNQSNRFFDSRIPSLVPQEITDQDLNLFNDIKSCDQMETEPRIKTGPETGSNQFQPTRLPPPIPPKPHSMRMNQERNHNDPSQNQNMAREGVTSGSGIQGPVPRPKTAKELRGSDPTIKMLKCTQGGSYRFSMR